MRFTVVTVCLNMVDTIGDTVASVRAQSHQDIEHLIVDGGSTDGSLERLRSLKDWGDDLISEPDDGLYDAMNKGLARATGDFIGFLNSDDYFIDRDAIARFAKAARRDQADVVCGDMRVVGQYSNRVYSGKAPWQWMMRLGHQPPHPAFYARTQKLRDLGGFNNDFRIAGDFDLILRLLTSGAKLSHVPGIIAEARVGGLSTSGLKSKQTINSEIVDSLRANGFNTHPIQVWSKYLFKVFQYRLGSGCGPCL